MTKLRLPKAFELLLVWHGLLVGSYTIAYLTAEGAPGLHQFAGYSALGLLAVRLTAALIAGVRPPWALPLPKASMWKNFGRKLAAGNFSALLGRTPFAPLSGLVILGTLVLVTLSGLAADWWEWEDLHEGLAESSLAVVLIHIAIVSFAPLLKRLNESRANAEATALPRNA
jgi:cytochrome b